MVRDMFEVSWEGMNCRYGMLLFGGFCIHLNICCPFVDFIEQCDCGNITGEIDMEIQGTKMATLLYFTLSSLCMMH